MARRYGTGRDGRVDRNAKKRWYSPLFQLIDVAILLPSDITWVPPAQGQYAMDVNLGVACVWEGGMTRDAAVGPLPSASEALNSYLVLQIRQG